MENNNLKIKINMVYAKILVKDANITQNAIKSLIIKNPKT